MTTKHADSQPSHDSKTSTEQITQDQSTEQPIGTFSIPTFANPSPKQVLNLQRTVGNTRTRQLLGERLQRSPRRIQREIGGGKTGGGISTTGVKLSWERTHSFPERSYGYATFKVEAGVAMEAELSWSEDSISVGAETKNGDENALKAKVGIWEDKAVEAEKEDIWKAVWDDHFKVQKADLEFELPKNASEGKQNNTTMGVALIVTTASGDEHKLFLNVFESKVNGAESSILGPHGGGEISISIIPPMLRSAALSQGLKLTGILKGKAALTVRPNWLAIASQVAQRFGPAFLGQALRGAAAGGGWLTSGLFSGAIATIVGYYEFIQQMAALRDLRQKADSAVPGYANGFMTGIGIEGYSGGDAGWATYGQARGQAALATGLQQMKTRLVQIGKQFGIDVSTVTDEEMATMLKEVIQQRAESLYSSLYGAVNLPIRTLHYRKYKESHSVDTAGSEMQVRAYAGLPVSGTLPDPFRQTDVPMESPAAPAGGEDNPAGSGTSNEEDDNSHSSNPDWKFSDPEVQQELSDQAAKQNAPAGNGGANKNANTGQPQHTPTPPKAPASARQAAQNDSTPTPYANNASGRSDEEQADAEEQERQLRAQHGMD